MLSDRCRVCGTDLRAARAHASTAAESDDWLRQIMEGACDACQRRRQSAAVEFMQAADAIRVAWNWTITEFGPTAIDHEPVPVAPVRTGARPGMRNHPAWRHVTDAAARCDRLHL